jgi:hypothetical protein
MPRLRTTVLFLIIIAILGVGALGVIGLLSPPYTDQQIRASLVDTWEAEAWSVSAALFLLFCAVVVSLALAYRGSSFTRRLSAAAVFSAISAGAIVLVGHIVLTRHVTQLTGQTFGAFYGLL